MFAGYCRPRKDAVSEVLSEPDSLRVSTAARMVIQLSFRFIQRRASFFCFTVVLQVSGWCTCICRPDTVRGDFFVIATFLVH